MWLWVVGYIITIFMFGRLIKDYYYYIGPIIDTLPKHKGTVESAIVAQDE